MNAECAHIASRFCFQFGQIYTPKWVAGSCDNSIFNFLRNFCTGFHSSGTVLHSHQKYTRLPTSLHPCQHLLLSVFGLDSGHPKRYEVMPHRGFDLICSSLMISDVEHLYVHLLVICVPSLGKMSM